MALSIARPTRTHWLALLLAIVASQAGQFLLKAGATGLPETDDLLPSLVRQVLRWQTVMGLCFYGSGTMLYIVALRRIPMSVAMPCTAISFAIAAAIGVLSFGEQVSVQHILGLTMICTGVCLFAKMSKE